MNRPELANTIILMGVIGRSIQPQDFGAIDRKILASLQSDGRLS
jgi:hypothetical protein